VAAAQTDPSALGDGVRRVATVCVRGASGDEVTSFPILKSPAVLKKDPAAARAVEALEELLSAMRQNGMIVMAMVPEAYPGAQPEGRVLGADEIIDPLADVDHVIFAGGATA
jgi:hypothetical protein